MKKFLSWLSLFASTGTLLCCALPSLLVVLGFGAAIAGLVTHVPALVAISQHKVWVFVLSGALIFVSYISRRQTQALACPSDKAVAAACSSSRVWSGRMLILSGLLWTVGAFFAFLAPHLF